MPTKLDTDKKLFLGTVATAETTTFGQIRKAVNDLNSGEGVSYADLEAHLIANFTPAKSANYGPSYIKAYVRDAVNKFGYLSHEDVAAEYEVKAPAPKKEVEAKPKTLTKAQKTQVETLKVIRDKGEVTDISEIDSSKITTETLVSETKKKTKTIDTLVAGLEKDGFVRTEKVEESTYVFLTAAGLAHVNENEAPAEAAPAAPENTAAETVGEDDSSEA